MIQLNITKAICTTMVVMLLPLLMLAQPRKGSDISGAWTGFVKTRDKKITYETVITRNGEELTGYSKIIFENKGQETYAIKSLSVRMEDDKYVFEEDSLLYDNFKEEAPRKIKQINTLELQIGNKKMTLTGTFKTKATMGLKSATGEVSLQKAVTPDSSMLFVELGTLIKTEDLSFVKEAKIAEEKAKIAAEKARIAEEQAQIARRVKDSMDAIAAVKKPANPPAAPKPVSAPPIVKATPPAPVPPPAAPVTVAKAPAPSPPVVKKQTIFSEAGTNAAANIKKRELENIQTVSYKTDSLVFPLYDNAEIDGDTVSVLVNGKVFMGKKGLSTRPVTETLYITPELGDTLQVIMYAESLGSIPPNTGLLIVQDGRDRYEIRFSGDLNKNASITFRRKK